MPAFQLHIQGLVQGVGFRPFVHKLAIKYHINGWVSNGTDGVRILANHGNNTTLEAFFYEILNSPPKNAVIISNKISEIKEELSSGFRIVESTNNAEANLMLTPDISMCEDCRKELNTGNNRRFGYPFITCVNCGPRYSIQTKLPYDRQHTTMGHLTQCNECQKEYDDPENIRHYSQTNSCPDCAIILHFYDYKGSEINLNQVNIILETVKQLSYGKIIALKGTGGYLLLCDAANHVTVSELRKRKNRPGKPFALLFSDIKSLKKEVRIRDIEAKSLQSEAAPIVLCKIQNPNSHLATEQIAPGLAKLGVMLPNSPLLQLISDNFGKPLVATSANLSGSPIVYLDEEALKYLGEFADFIITYDREIVAPQDDSVEQFTESGQKIILRRSRGLAPNFYPITFSLPKTPTLAMGADMKAVFGVNTGKNLFISQYLGDQSSFDSQQSYDNTLNHITNLMDFVPKTIISDLHPGYFTSQKAEELKIKYNSEIIQIQHHKAHFLSVLAENNLLDLKDKTLGVIWDGVGYGEDGKIWGGEFFTFQNKKIERVAHWEYFPQLLGDKMSKEPRLSALSLLKKSKHKEILRPYFSEREWVFYENLVETSPEIQTSSMGRMMDGLACILGLKAINTYEGEAAMLLENLAAKNPNKTRDFYTFELKGAILNNVSIFENILEDIQNKMPVAEIAEKFFNTLVKSIERISVENQTRRIAFSGGVMQNTFLVDKIIENLGKRFDLYFHQQLSPNDENIALGQLAFHYLEEEILGIGNLEKNIKIG